MPRAFDEDAAHGQCRSGKEMPAPIPLAFLIGAGHSQVGFVNEGGGLQGLLMAFARAWLYRMLGPAGGPAPPDPEGS